MWLSELRLKVLTGFAEGSCSLVTMGLDVIEWGFLLLYFSVAPFPLFYFVPFPCNGALGCLDCKHIIILYIVSIGGWPIRCYISTDRGI